MQADALFSLLRQAQNRIGRLPMQIRVGGVLVDVSSIGLETLPGGRLVVTLTPAETLRTAAAPAITLAASRDK